jgi:hypothetical protein
MVFDGCCRCCCDCKNDCVMVCYSPDGTATAWSMTLAQCHQAIQIVWVYTPLVYLTQTAGKPSRNVTNTQNHRGRLIMGDNTLEDSSSLSHLGHVWVELLWIYFWFQVIYYCQDVSPWAVSWGITTGIIPEISTADLLGESFISNPGCGRDDSWSDCCGGFW